MISRRRILATSTAAVSLGAPRWAIGQTVAPPSPDGPLAHGLESDAQTLVGLFPEDATALDLDVGAQSVLRGRLNDRSLASQAALRVWSAGRLAWLRQMDQGALTTEGRRDHGSAVFVYETLNDCLCRYGFIDLNLRPSPYVVSQMNGAYYWLPDFIGTRHPLQTADDVGAWFARVDALPEALDQETERIRHDAGLSVTPPRIVIDQTLLQISKLRDEAPNASALLGPAIERARARGLGDLAPRAGAMFHDRVVPALSRQMQALEALKPGASDTAGVWRLPDGEGYYAAALRANTTVDTTPAELHALGLAQVEDLLNELDLSLRAQGLTGGSVASRIDALNRDPRFLVSNDDVGRARLIDLAQHQLAQVTSRLPRAFRDPVVDPIAVRRVAPAVESGAPAAFYEEGGEGQEGAFMLNLGRPADYPLWRLATLTHHEGVPGHHYQFGVVRRSGQLPLFRRLVQFSAYTEGWALYAQQVADEMGVYEQDPFGRIGYLQSALFRAARIVVDTGLHHHRWTREEAVDWMVLKIGETPEATRREIDRYCVYPGQACSFTVGANTIVAARKAAQQRQLGRFDVRDFHDMILKPGPSPMGALSAMIEQWRV